MSAIDRISEVNIHFPHHEHSPIVFDFIYDFFQLNSKTLSKQAWWKGKYGKIDRALQAVDWDFELSNLSVNDMFYILYSIMSPLVNIYVPLSQEKPSYRSVKRTSI